MDTDILALFPFASVAKVQKKGLTPTQAAYMAGLLDGEGHFGMQRKLVTSRGYRYKTFEAFVVLVMTNKVFMETIAALVPWGGGTVGRNSRVLHGRARPGYRMKWSSTAAVQLCRAILPYLRLKTPHAKLIIALADAKAGAQAERSGRGHAYPARIVQLQEAMFVAMRNLNKRGQDNVSCRLEEAAKVDGC